MKKIYIATPIDGLTDDMRARLVQYISDEIVPLTPNKAKIVCPIVHYHYNEGIYSGDPSSGEIIEENTLDIAECDELIAINPYQSGGVTFEIGYAHALHKPVKIIELDWLESKFHCPTIMTDAVR